MEHKAENQPKEQILTLNPIMDIKGQRLFQLPFDMKRESVNQKNLINIYKYVQSQMPSTVNNRHYYQGSCSQNVKPI